MNHCQPTAGINQHCAMCSKILGRTDQFYFLDLWWHVDCVSSYVRRTTVQARLRQLGILWPTKEFAEKRSGLLQKRTQAVTLLNQRKRRMERRTSFWIETTVQDDRSFVLMCRLIGIRTIARAVKLSPATLSRWLRGQNGLTEPNYNKINVYVQGWKEKLASQIERKKNTNGQRSTGNGWSRTWPEV